MDGSVVNAAARLQTAAPTNGIALSPVSSVPLMSPLRLTVETTVARAIAPPIQGMDFANRRDSRALPHLATRFVIVIPPRSCN